MKFYFSLPPHQSEIKRSRELKNTEYKDLLRMIHPGAPLLLVLLTLFFLPIFSSPDHKLYVPGALLCDLHSSSALLRAGTNILGFHTGDA